jgi:Carbohydrate binding domain/PEP-CTERM motif
MTNMRTVKAFALAMILCAPWHSGAWADLIINGGFETGDFSGWTVTNNTDINGVDSSNPHSGTYEAFFGQITADGLVSISQSVATIPGQSYTLSFWVMAEPGSGFSGTPDEFRASFGGNALLDLLDLSPFPYTHYTYTVTATSPSSLVQFDATNDAGFFDLDDVSMTALAATSTAPEPGSLTLLGIGMACIAGYRLRRRNK